MAKTKFKVDLHKSGMENASLLAAVANHNNSIVPISIVDLQSYMQVRKAMFPSSNDGYYATRSQESESILNISEDGGKTWTLTIEEIEVHELEEEPIAHV